MNPVMIAIIAFTSLFHSTLEVTPTIASSTGATMESCPCTPPMQSLANTTSSPPISAPQEYYPDTEIPKGYKKRITIAYLTAIHGTIEARQGLAISGALQLALEEVSSNFVGLFS